MANKIKMLQKEQEKQILISEVGATVNSNYENYIYSLINRRRRQILVHSVLYYRMATNLIDDATWSKWALELEDLQEQYPSISCTVPYYEAFKDFDHSTGQNLPLDDQWAIGAAAHILALSNS